MAIHYNAAAAALLIGAALVARRTPVAWQRRAILLVPALLVLIWSGIDSYKVIFSDRVDGQLCTVTTWRARWLNRGYWSRFEVLDRDRAVIGRVEGGLDWRERKHGAWEHTELVGDDPRSRETYWWRHGHRTTESDVLAR